jgi:hypothetical protein
MRRNVTKPTSRRLRPPALSAWRVSLVAMPDITRAQ